MRSPTNRLAHCPRCGTRSTENGIGCSGFDAKTPCPPYPHCAKCGGALVLGEQVAPYPDTDGGTSHEEVEANGR